MMIHDVKQHQQQQQQKEKEVEDKKKKEVEEMLMNEGLGFEFSFLDSVAQSTRFVTKTLSSGLWASRCLIGLLGLCINSDLFRAIWLLVTNLGSYLSISQPSWFMLAINSIMIHAISH